MFYLCYVMYCLKKKLEFIFIQNNFYNLQKTDYKNYLRGVKNRHF